MLKEQVIKENNDDSQSRKIKSVKGYCASLAAASAADRCRRPSPADMPAMLQRLPTIKHMKTESYPHTGTKRKRKTWCPSLLANNFHRSIILRSTSKKKKKKRETKIILLPQRNLPQSRQGGPSYFCTLGELCLTLHMIQRPAPSNAFDICFFVFWLFVVSLVVALQCHVEH